MANPIDVDKLSESEIDKLLMDQTKTEEQSTVQKSVDEMSEEEVDSALKNIDEPKKDSVETFFEGKDIFDVVKDSEGFREAASKSDIPSAKALSGVMETAKTTGEIGQSIIAANAAGMIMRGVPLISNVLGKQKIIQGLLASAETKAANAGLRLSNIQRAIQRQAIEGAVAAQAFDYESVKNRIVATGLAAAISPTIGMAAQGLATGAVKTSRDLQKLIKRASLPVRKTYTGSSLRDPRAPALGRVVAEHQAADKASSEISQAAAKQISTQNTARTEATSFVSERASTLKSNISSAVKEEQGKIRLSLKETQKQIESSIKSAEQLLDKESDIAAISFQNNVGRFFKGNSVKYGRELNNISNKLAETGRMTRGEAAEVLQKTVERSVNEAEIEGGTILSKVNDLIKNKYGLDITDAAGKKIIRNAGDLVSFKEFLNDVRSIWKGIKPYKGASRFSQEDIPAAILQSEFGEMITRMPGGEMFTNLQKAYRPVISYMNKINSILKPYKGEAYREQAYNFVKKISKGEASPVEKDIMSFLENGTERFAKGVGSFSARARQLGENIKILGEELGKQGMLAEKRILKIAEEGALKLSKIDATASNAKDLIAKEADKRSAMIFQEAASEQAKFWGRAKQLSKREMILSNLARRQQVLRNIGIAGATLVGGLTSAYVVVRGGRQLFDVLTRES